MLSTKTSTLSWMPWFPTHPQWVSLSENLVLPSKISSIWSLLTTFIATLRLLLYNSLLRGGYPSTLLNPLWYSLSTVAWAILLKQPHHTARTCQTLTVACKTLQNLPLLYWAALFPFPHSSPALLGSFAVSLSHTTRGPLSLFFLLPGMFLLQTAPVYFLTAFRVSDQTDLRKAFLYCL